MEWADGYNTVFNFTVIFILAWMEEGQLINFWAPNNQHNVISVKSLQIFRCTLDEVHTVSFTDTRAATHSAPLPPPNRCRCSLAVIADSCFVQCPKGLTTACDVFFFFYTNLVVKGIVQLKLKFHPIATVPMLMEDLVKLKVVQTHRIPPSWQAVAAKKKKQHSSILLLWYHPGVQKMQQSNSSVKTAMLIPWSKLRYPLQPPCKNPHLLCVHTRSARMPHGCPRLCAPGSCSLSAERGSEPLL